MLDLKKKGVTLIGIDCFNIERLIEVADFCEAHCMFADVKVLTHLDSSDKRVVKIKKIQSKKAYSHFMMKCLAEYIDTDFALVFQYDGYIQNTNAWTDEFLIFCSNSN